MEHRLHVVGVVDLEVPIVAQYTDHATLRLDDLLDVRCGIVLEDGRVALELGWQSISVEWVQL